MSLQKSLFNEAMFPILEWWPAPIEDKSIPLLPDVPWANHKNSHEEIVGKLLFGLLHHRVKVKIEIPIDIEVSPAFLAKGAREEKMEGGFLSIKNYSDPK
jgi:hypothetical protein